MLPKPYAVPMGKLNLRSIILNDILALRAVHPRLRTKMYRTLGLNIGDSRIHGAATITGRDVTIGDGTFIGYGCFLDGDGGVEIGDNCNIGPRVSIHSVTHEIGTSKRRAGTHRYLRAAVEDGVWIGAGSTILPGVRVGAGCVVAAGAIVTKDCAPNGLYAGVPARRIKDLT